MVTTDKEHWNEILHISRRKILKAFFAGAVVTAVILILVFYIFTKTGFIL